MPTLFRLFGKRLLTVPYAVTKLTAGGLWSKRYLVFAAVELVFVNKMQLFVPFSLKMQGSIRLKKEEWQKKVHFFVHDISGNKQ
ncbi:MAG: hypothetical protein KatS3mg031_2348 [Chitinophagales bacterium]|nr:MAG: hypothetical protein KatS3mg031_2348 [Chitinophagales bacterium]